MNQVDVKPLKWNPDEDAGFTVVRRPDGGMHLTVTDISDETLQAWRAFAMDHLSESDRLTRNLYDLRRIEKIPEKAVHFAVEALNDPATRNIRLAVVVANEEVANSIRKIAALSTSPGGGADLKLFTDLEEAEKWLSKSLGTMA